MAARMVRYEASVTTKENPAVNSLTPRPKIAAAIVGTLATALIIYVLRKLGVTDLEHEIVEGTDLTWNQLATAAGGLAAGYLWPDESSYADDHLDVDDEPTDDEIAAVAAELDPVPPAPAGIPQLEQGTAASPVSVPAGAAAGGADSAPLA